MEQIYKLSCRTFVVLAVLLGWALMPGYGLAQTEPVQGEDGRADTQVQTEGGGRARIDRNLGTDDRSTFMPHKLNYGVLGVDDALMQFSFKYRMVRNWGLYLAFTNVVKWDIYGDSTPYHDINFMPELFYRFTPEGGWLFSMDVGYWHNSNGKAGELDRAWDQLFGRFSKTFEIDHMSLVWVTDVYWELGTNYHNRNIDEYLGWWDTGVTLMDLLPRKGNNIDLEFFMWSGENGVPFRQGQFRAGLVYEINTGAFQPSFYLQYFNGYGEVIRDHDVRTEDLRFGITFLY